MDPGNWATDLAGGSKFGYTLDMGITDEQPDGLVTAEFISARLGIVRGRDLAQANRETYPKKINYAFYGYWLKSPLPPPTWPKYWVWPSVFNY